MKLLLFIGLIFPLSQLQFDCSGQDIAKADSFRHLLSSAEHDTTKMKFLLCLAKYDVPINSLNYAKEALALAKKNKDLEKQAFAFQYISLCNRKLGNYADALKASFLALALYDQLALPDKTASMQLQIGGHFANDKNYQKAIYYIKKALTAFKDNKDTTKITLTLINLGETYRLMNYNDSSEACFQKCLELNKKPNNQLIEGYALGNLGLVHAQQKLYNHSKPELTKAITILKELGDVYSSTVYQSELAKIIIQEGNSTEGEQLLLQSLQTAKKETLKEQIRDISKELSLYFEKKNLLEKALHYRKQYEIYNDSLVDIDNVRRVEQLQSKYYLDKKEADIKLLEIKNHNKQKTVWLLSIGTLLLLSLSLFLLRIQKLRKLAYNKVSEQKRIIEEREKEKALLLRELNHRVKNNLQMIASIFNLQANRFKGHAASDALKSARHRVEALTLIHQKLYRQNTDTQLKLADYINELVENLIFSFGKKIELNLDLAPISLHIDAAIPLGIILNELITNSLKYALCDTTPTLTISLKQTNNQISLSITDNGKGLPSDWEHSKSQSMGLKLVNSLIKQLKGSLQQSNSNGCKWEIIINSDNLHKYKNE